MLFAFCFLLLTELFFRVVSLMRHVSAPYMQLVTPSEVAMAVSTVTMMWMRSRQFCLVIFMLILMVPFFFLVVKLFSG